MHLCCSTPAPSRRPLLVGREPFPTLGGAVGPGRFPDAVGRVLPGRVPRDSGLPGVCTFCWEMQKKPIERGVSGTRIKIGTRLLPFETQTGGGGIIKPRFTKANENDAIVFNSHTKPHPTGLFFTSKFLAVGVLFCIFRRVPRRGLRKNAHGGENACSSYDTLVGIFRGEFHLSHYFAG